ncbi:unnamed protein product [Echinostoma caproni]|uniref:THIF-type NAD/FAD binding fold domain-containing protein n=1 Tax=Echinostoma caproni TaxID=27848 RepID=A0A3P8GIL8_9TREM|nr:unnamed protein product [Echinostoma caproni]
MDATGSDAPNHCRGLPVTAPRHTGIVLAALDCIPSRRYLDQRCVSLHLPLFESGTLGTKGHVQVVLPGWTESYNSQFDDDSGGAGDGAPGAGSIPYCTLKSFPSLPVHCIEWAREKFASQFTLKPKILSQLIASSSAHGPDRLIQLASDLLCSSTGSVTNAVQMNESEKSAQTTWLRSQLTRSVARFMASRPTDWIGCVRLGRDKFERYFNHKPTFEPI